MYTIFQYENMDSYLFFALKCKNVEYECCNNMIILKICELCDITLMLNNHKLTFNFYERDGNCLINTKCIEFHSKSIGLHILSFYLQNQLFNINCSTQNIFAYSSLMNDICRNIEFFYKI